MTRNAVDTPAKLPLEQVIAQIADYTQDAIVITEPDPREPRIVYVNRAFTEITGYAAEEVLGKPPRILQGPGTDDAARERIRNALNAWHGVRTNILNYRRTGEPFWVELVIMPVNNPTTGLTDYWVSVQRNIDDQILTERRLALHDLAHRYSQESAIVCETGPDGVEVIYASPAYLRAAGMDEAAVIGAAPDLLQSADNVARDIENLLAALAQRRPASRVIRTLEADGEYRWRDVQIQPLEDSDREVLVTLRDVTRIRQQDQELSEAEKFNAVGQLASGLAHDFNNVLTVIMGNLESALSIVADPRARRCIDTAFRASRGAAELSTQLLSLARPTQEATTWCDVTELMENVTNLLQHTLPGNVELQTNVGERLPAVPVSASRLESTIVNLALNAVQAMPGGGTLRIEVEPLQVRDDEGGLADGPHLAFTISDDGIGMDAETRSRIFEPFFTTRGNDGGTGLGTSMVYAFVKQAGGRIGIDSAPGAGTRIRFLLPAREQREPERGSARWGSPAVLLVEDNAALREMLSSWLRRHGCKVTTSDSAIHAVDLFDAHPQSFDLVFTDVVLTGTMTGMDLVRDVRSIRPDTPIVVMTGYTPEQLPASLEEGPHEFLPKPFTLDTLGAALDRLFADR